MPRENTGPHLVRGEVNWEISFTHEGRSRRRSTSTSDLRQAQKVLANFLLLTDRDAALGIEPEIVLVRDVLGDPDAPSGGDYWHEHVIPNVIAKDLTRLTLRWLTAHFGNLKVRSLLPVDFQSYVERRARGEVGNPAGPGTIRRELGVLTAALNHAAAAKRISRDDVPTIKRPDAPDPKDRWLTRDEAGKLLHAALEGRAGGDRLPRVYKFIVLALATASRRTALEELMIGQVDMDRGLIALNPPGRRQTRKRRPTVPISDWLRPHLTRMIAESEDGHLLGTGGSIRVGFENAVKRAGLEGVTPHTLRHTWATWATQEGVDLWKVAGVLGDSVVTVERIYAHHAPEHLRGAVNAARMAA